LQSYPITRAEYVDLNIEQLTARLETLVPEEHMAFLESFEDQIIIGDYAFVHAGIRPGVPLSEQKPSDLRWIREEFVGQRGDLEKVIIYGHTIYGEVEERGSRIGIDTGAYSSGKLTAIGLEGGERWYLQT
jgi:serine/threonine protein phosphatase 1